MKNQTLELAARYLMPNYGTIGIQIISGLGPFEIISDENGEKKECLDFLCGLGVNSLGHCHPAIVRAINRQTKKLMHVSNLYATEPMAKLAEALVKEVGWPGARVFFCNSGTEANEAAGKLARIYAHQHSGPYKKKIIALKNSFHGRTFLSISMTGQEKMQDKFAPTVPKIQFVKLNDVKGLCEAADETVCAVIFETIQAEGGINLMTPKFYHEIQRLAVKYNFLTICDEVQTGIGRTGKMFSFKHFRGKPEDGPDIITLAKALGGGLPIGAVIAKAGVGDYLLPGSHAATFGGNPVCCAAALAVIKVINENHLLRYVETEGKLFLDSLRGMAREFREKVKEVRGRGFMIGVELQEGYSAAEVARRMLAQKSILIGTAGPQVVRFLPPLNVQRGQIAYAVESFKEVLQDL